MQDSSWIFRTYLYQVRVLLFKYGHKIRVIPITSAADCSNPQILLDNLITQVGSGCVVMRRLDARIKYLKSMQWNWLVVVDPYNRHLYLIDEFLVNHCQIEYKYLVRAVFCHLRKEFFIYRGSSALYHNPVALLFIAIEKKK